MHMGAGTGMLLRWVKCTLHAMYFVMVVGSFIVLTSMHPCDATPDWKCLATITGHEQIYPCYSATDLIGY